MDYTLHQLRIFIKVVEYQSITKASDALYLTQPAVSLQLKKFQAQFEVPLTEVVGRKLYVTDFGKEIAEYSQKILNEIDAINYRTKSYKGQLAGKIKLSSASTGKYVMPYFLADFVRIHPHVDLVMDVTNKSLVIKSLEQNEVDFALISIVPEHLNLQMEPLLANQLYLVGGTCLKRNPKHSIRDIFEKHPLLYREYGSATRSAMEQFIAEENLSAYKKIELTSNEAVKQALIAGLGYSIMPIIGIKNELKNGDLEIVPHPKLPVVTNWNLVWLSAKRLSPVAEAFLQYVRAEKEHIVKKHFAWQFLDAKF